VLDVNGRRVASLASQTLSAGTHALAWDGNMAGGERASPGVYLVRVRWAGFERTQRIVRLQ
jgi:flagellar hook assembly protein FlgD